MAARKRKSVRKTRKVTKAVEKTTKTTHPQPQPDKCNMKHVCDFMEKLSKYLQDFNADYKKLRIAVCNLDHQVFGAGGDLSLRFCTGGASGEPADPPPPPIW